MLDSTFTAIKGTIAGGRSWVSHMTRRNRNMDGNVDFDKDMAVCKDVDGRGHAHGIGFEQELG